MAKINQQQLEDHILNGSEHTLQSLSVTFSDGSGVATETEKMQIDRTLQKLRRAGKIHFVRSGRATIWKAGAAPSSTSPSSHATA